MEEKSLTLGRFNKVYILHLITSILVIISSFLSLRHYFLANFPSSIFSGSFCDISAFFNCDNSAYSFIAEIYGIPLGYFGIVVGMASLMGIFFPSYAFERTNKFINFFNVLGILGLIFISVLVLKSVCLLCVAYYIFSFLNFFLYAKYGAGTGSGFFQQYLRPNFRYLFGIGLLTLLGAVGMVYYHQAKLEAQGGGVTDKIVQQYFNLPKVKNPSIISPYYLVQATDKFEDAPIRIVEYADFRCPDCRILLNDFIDLKEEFKGKMNIVFQFFPLEGKCNSVVAKDLHPNACDLSYIAAHDPSQFLAIHDEIFGNFKQTDSKEWVMNLARKYGVEAALTDANTQQIVHDIINTGREYQPTSDRFQFGIRSTPTMILNERIVIGTFPKAQLRAIFKAILRKEQKETPEEFIENWK